MTGDEDAQQGNHISLNPPSSESLHNKGRVVTLGMFIIDHFRGTLQASDGSEDLQAIGGGGVYAMTAARMFLPASHCGLIVDEGTDFPQLFKRELLSLGQEMLWFRPRPNITTRALNLYSGARIGEGSQSFEYLTDRIKLTPDDLFDPRCPFTRPHPPEWIHVVSTAERALEIVEELDRLSSPYGKRRLRIAWEPLGASCNPESYRTILNIVPRVDAFSPNILEMRSLLGLDTEESARSVVESAQMFSTALPEDCTTAVIVRAGALGSYTSSPQWSGWVPAYWTDQKRVVDTTGGGNAWMGGLCAGLLLTDNWRIASIYGSTAASFAIQQQGLPVISRDGDGERWNGDDPWTRLRMMMRRVDAQDTTASEAAPQQAGDS